MKANDPLLRASHLSLGYGPSLVLNCIHFAVRAGEFWFLIGPNGSGKSTLLKALVGLLAPRAGEIGFAPALHSRTPIGFVPQSCDLNPSLPTTIREFVLLGLVGIKSTRQEAAERLAWALDKVDLLGLERRDYWALSGGERQRTLIARALVRRPALLIMDEPTGGLDFAVETRLMECLGRLNREEGMTIVCVSHDLQMAMSCGTHVGLVCDGGMQTGRPQEVLSPENIKRVYGLPLALTGGGNHRLAQAFSSIL